MKYLILPLLLAFFATSCTRVVVVERKDNGKHKGWFKNRHNPHHPNSNNPGHKKKGNPGHKNKFYRVDVF